MNENLLDGVTRLLCIRHGETDWNREGRIQGHLDLPLSALGRSQAERLAVALDDEPLQALYSSDLVRARETAAGLARRHGLQPVLRPALRERSFGQMEGLCWPEIESRHPEDARRWRSRDPAYAVPGGESLLDFNARVLGIVAELAAAHAGQTIAIVAHGGVMDCLYRAATGVDLQAPRSWQLGNASVNRLLCTSEGLTLIGWNDDAHLQGLVIA